MKYIVMGAVAVLTLMSGQAMACEKHKHPHTRYDETGSYQGSERYYDYKAKHVNRQDIAHTQKALRKAGYDVGPIDAVLGSQTRAALKAFQADQNLPVTGELTGATMRRLKVHVPPEFDHRDSKNYNN